MFTSGIENVIINETLENVQENGDTLNQTYHYAIPLKDKKLYNHMTVNCTEKYPTKKRNNAFSNNSVISASDEEVSEGTQNSIEEISLNEVDEIITLSSSTKVNARSLAVETSNIEWPSLGKKINKSDCVYGISNPLTENRNNLTIIKVEPLDVANGSDFDFTDAICSSVAACERNNFDRKLPTTIDALNLSPDKSRYGRTRKPKVSCDFISIDKQKDFNNCIEPDSSSIRKKMRIPKRKSNFSYPFAGDEGVKKIRYENGFSKFDNDSADDIKEDEEIITDWDLGDVAWAKRGFKPYWPCVISVDPDSSSYEINVEKSNKRTWRKYHVNFIKDNGRHAWLLSSNLMPFRNKQQFFDHKQNVKNNKSKLKNFTLATSTLNCWNAAVDEAEVLLTLPRDERIKLYTDNLDMLPFFKSSPSVERTRFNNNSSLLPEIKLEPNSNSYDSSTTTDFSFTFAGNLPSAITSKGLRFIPRRNSITLPLSHGIENITIDTSDLEGLSGITRPNNNYNSRTTGTTTEAATMLPKKTVRFLRVRNLHENRQTSRQLINPLREDFSSTATTSSSSSSSSSNNRHREKRRSRKIVDDNNVAAATFDLENGGSIDSAESLSTTKRRNAAKNREEKLYNNSAKSISTKDCSNGIMTKKNAVVPRYTNKRRVVGKSSSVVVKRSKAMMVKVKRKNRNTETLVKNRRNRPKTEEEEIVVVDNHFFAESNNLAPPPIRMIEEKSETASSSLTMREGITNDRRDESTINFPASSSINPSVVKIKQEPIDESIDSSGSSTIPPPVVIQLESINNTSALSSSIIPVKPSCEESTTTVVLFDETTSKSSQQTRRFDKRPPAPPPVIIRKIMKRRVKIERKLRREVSHLDRLRTIDRKNHHDTYDIRNKRSLSTNNNNNNNTNGNSSSSNHFNNNNTKNVAVKIKVVKGKSKTVNDNDVVVKTMESKHSTAADSSRGFVKKKKRVISGGDRRMMLKRKNDKKKHRRLPSLRRKPIMNKNKVVTETTEDKKKTTAITGGSTADGIDKLNPGFKIFSSKFNRQISSKHPRMNSASVKNLLRKKWKSLSKSQQYRYNRAFKLQNGFEKESSVCGTSKETAVNKVKTEEDNEKETTTSTSSNSRLRKNGCLFAGLKFEKVCQLCEKAGGTVRCQGPCGSYYHVACVQSQDINISKNGNPSPRRGSRKIVMPARYASCDRFGSVRRNIVRMFDDSDGDDGGDCNDIDDTTSIDNNNSRLRNNVKTRNTDNKNMKSADIIIKREKTPRSNLSENPEEDTFERSSAQNEDTLDDSVDSEANIGIVKSENKDDIVVGRAFVAVKSSSKSDLKTIVIDNADNDVKVKTELLNDPESTVENNDNLLIVRDNDDDDLDDDVNSNNQTDNVIGNGVVGPSSNCAAGDVFKCKMCSNSRIQPCFICGFESDPKTESLERIRCQIASCGRVFHKECLKDWPQTTWSTGKVRVQANSKEKPPNTTTTILTCPQHNCHICISDNPAVLRTRINNERLIRCIRCPTSYHRKMHCIPAGSKLLSTSQMICPRHYKPSKSCKTYHFNTLWCFICAKGGSLICCDLCPTSFHVDCLKLRKEEYEGSYICEDCQTGRFPLYGEIVWVKLGHYRWWPARILFPFEIPENVFNIPHDIGEFVVFFFGSKDHYWVNRGRVFLYQEGDSGKASYKKNAVDLTFERAVQEAQENFVLLKSEKSAREVELKIDTKPPRYTKIKTNRPVGNVRIVDENPANIPACDCDPHSRNPCGPGGDCINRMLMIECNPSVCPAGKRCNNQCFEKRLYPPLIPYRTENRGWGLKTLVPIKKGDFVIEYVGEMIDEEEYRKRVSRMHRTREDNYYFLTIDKDRMLDAGPKGNVSRFMNHSCDPNCETQKWTVNGDTRVGLFALQDVPSNTELVFNYHLDSGGAEKKPCNCGTANCSGFIGVKVNKKVTKNKSDKSPPKSRAKKRRLHVKRNRGRTSATQIEKTPVKCFLCNKSGRGLVTCNLKSCCKTYHLSCVNTSNPSRGVHWMCPWHFCNVCKSKRNVSKCSQCLNAFCSKHAKDNIVLNSVTGNVCNNHSAPTMTAATPVTATTNSNVTTAVITGTAKAAIRRKKGRPAIVTKTCNKRIRKCNSLSSRNERTKSSTVKHPARIKRRLVANLNTVTTVVIKKSPKIKKLSPIKNNNSHNNNDIAAARQTSKILNTSLRYDETTLSNLKTYSKAHTKSTSPLTSPQKCNCNGNDNSIDSIIIDREQNKSSEEIKIIDASTNNNYVVNELQNADAIIYKNTIAVTEVTVIDPRECDDDDNAFCRRVLDRSKKYFVPESLDLKNVTETLLSLSDTNEQQQQQTEKNKLVVTSNRSSSIPLLNVNNNNNSEKTSVTNESNERRSDSTFVSVEMKLSELFDDNRLNTIDHKSNIISHKANQIDHKANQIDHKADKVDHKENKIGHKEDKIDHKEDKIDHKEDKFSHKEDKIVHKENNVNHKDDEVDHKAVQIDDKDKVNHKEDKFSHKEDKIGHKENNVSHKDDKIDHKEDKIDHKEDKIDHKADKFDLEVDKVNHEMDEVDHKVNKFDVKSNKVGLNSSNNNTGAGVKTNGVKLSVDDNTLITTEVTEISDNDEITVQLYPIPDLNVTNNSSDDGSNLSRISDITTTVATTTTPLSDVNKTPSSDNNDTSISSDVVSPTISSPKIQGCNADFGNINSIISPLNKAAVAIANFRNKKLSSDDLPLSRTKSLHRLKHHCQNNHSNASSSSYLLSPLKSSNDTNSRIETSYLLISSVVRSESTICNSSDGRNDTSPTMIMKKEQTTTP